MNGVSRRTVMENQVASMKNIVGKGAGPIPAMQQKSRVFGNVGNFCKPSIDSKASAIERQRANADKLSKGYSVVPLKDKENSKDSRITLGSSAKENGITNSNASIRSVNSALHTFRQPVKPAKTKKPSVQPLHKSQSVTSLQNYQQSPQKTKVEIPLSFEHLVIDEDKKYENDENMLGLYSQDIYKFLRQIEKEQLVRPSYLTRQHLVTAGQRAVLVDWMYEVQQSFNLLQDTTQMSIALLDRFLQDSPRLPKDDLQLLGVTCILLASKYEEMYPPVVSDLVLVSADAFTKSQILRMEQRVFRNLDFSIGRPPPSHFLRRYSRVGNVDSVTYTISKYLVDLALVQYSFCHLLPSMLAAVALYMALFVQAKGASYESVWTPTLIYYSGYTYKDLEPILPKFAKLILQAPQLKQQCVQKIYAKQKKQPSVSGMPELSSERLISLSKLDS